MAGKRAPTTPLTGKQQAFIDAYFAFGFNATRAAREAGYEGDANSLGVIGHENLRNTKIRKAIDARFKTLAMGADEVLARLADHAAGDIGTFIRIDPESGKGEIDLSSAVAQGKTHLIKKFSIRRSEFTEEHSIELYDAQAALNTLAKHLKLLTDRLELSGNDGGAIVVKAIDYRTGLGAVKPTTDESES